MIYYVILPFVFAPFFIILEVDPPYIFYKLVLISLEVEVESLFVTNLVFLIRVIYIFICTLEGARMFAFCILYILLRTCGFSTVFRKLTSSLQKVYPGPQYFSEIEKCCHHLNIFRIILQHCRIETMNILCLSSITLVGLAILSNFATIKMHGIFNTIFYLCFASISTGIFTVIPKLISIVLDCGEAEGKLLLELKERIRFYMCSNNGNGGDSFKYKILRKRVKSLYPIGLRIGMGHFAFKECTMEGKVEIYEVIVEHTITCLLSIRID